MRALRENMVPVAFLAVWMAASIYTMDALASMRPSRTVAASMDVTMASTTPTPIAHQGRFSGSMRCAVSASSAGT